jgi:hypothetical protein
VAAGVAVNPGVVDDRVHPAELVDLVGHGSGLLEVGEVADHHGRTAVGEVGQVFGPVVAAGVDDDLVAGGEQCGGGGRPRPWAEPVMKMRDMFALGAFRCRVRTV